MATADEFMSDHQAALDENTPREELNWLLQYISELNYKNQHAAQIKAIKKLQLQLENRAGNIEIRKVDDSVIYEEVKSYQKDEPIPDLKTP